MTEQNKDGAKCGHALLEGRSTNFFSLSFSLFLSLSFSTGNLNLKLAGTVGPGRKLFKADSG